MNHRMKILVSSFLCGLLVLISVVEIIRVLFMGTILNQSFYFKHQEEARFYQYVHTNLMQELKEIINKYELPNDLILDLVSQDNVKEIIRLQTTTVVQLPPNKERVEAVTFDYLIDDFKLRYEQYESKEKIDQSSKLMIPKQQLYEEINQSLKFHLEVFNPVFEANNPRINNLRMFITVITHESFEGFVAVLFIFTILGLIMTWGKKIYEIVYYISISVVCSGFILLTSYLFLYKFSYSLIGQEFEAGKQIMYEIIFNDVIKLIASFGSIEFVIGIILVIFMMFMKHLKEIKSLYI